MQWTTISSANLRSHFQDALRGNTEEGFPCLESERLDKLKEHVLSAMESEGHGTCILMLGLTDQRHHVSDEQQDVQADGDSVHIQTALNVKVMEIFRPPS